MRYVVDIDGTICTPGKTEETRYTQALPIQDRIDKINRLYDEGHTVVYLTARGMGRHNNNADKAKEELKFEKERAKAIKSNLKRMSMEIKPLKRK